MYQRKDGIWAEKITLPTGKRKEFYSGETTKRKAEKEIQQKILEYQEKDANTALFQNIAEDWKYDHWANISFGTQRCYNAPYKNLIVNFSEYYIKDIDIKTINLFLERLKKQGYSLKTIKTHRILLNLIFAYALVNGYINENVIPYTTLPNGLKFGKREMPTDEQIDLVKNSVNCHFGLFAYFILYSGLRRGEALAITDKDIDYNNHIIHVCKSVTYENNHPVIGNTKTECGVRNVFLLPLLEEKIKGFKGYLFGGEKPMTEMAYRRAYERYKKQSGVNLTAHQLRHAYATILYEAGIGDKDAQLLMGHADIKTTKNIYTHISDKQKSKTYDRLSEYCRSNS